MEWKGKREKRKEVTNVIGRGINVIITRKTNTNQREGETLT